MGEPPDSPKTASLFQAIKMVLSAFIGLRKQHPDQQLQVTPLQVVITGILCGAMFVFSIMMVVRFVLGK